MTERILKPTNPNNRYIKDYVMAVEKGMKSPHVVPLSTGQWAVKTLSSPKPLGVYATKSTATTYAYEITEKSSSGVFIHTKTGKIVRK